VGEAFSVVRARGRYDLVEVACFLLPRCLLLGAGRFLPFRAIGPAGEESAVLLRAALQQPSGSHTEFCQNVLIVLYFIPQFGLGIR